MAQVLWNTLIGAVPLSGKNNQQIQGAITKQVKKYQKLLEAFSGSARLEAALMIHIQVRACMPTCGGPAAFRRARGSPSQGRHSRLDTSRA